MEISFAAEDGPHIERPDNMWYYRNYYPKHAPSYLKNFLKTVQSLELIPSSTNWFGSEYKDRGIDVCQETFYFYVELLLILFKV